MRFLLVLVSLLVASGLAAAQSPQDENRIQYYYGRGSHSAYCTEYDFFCLERIKETARREAVEDATWQCRVNKGQADTIGSSCSEICIPNYLPPGSNPTYVSCRSDCRIRCHLPDDPNLEVAE